MSTPAPHVPDPYLPGHGDTRYRVRRYELRLAYRVATNRLDEKATLHVVIAEPTSRIEVDLYRLNVGKVLVEGKPARHRRTGHRVSIDVGKRQPGDRFALDLTVSGKPGPMPGVHGEAGWEELTDGAMVGSQPQGAPSWFPCNNDAADKATYRIEVTTDSAYAVVANGTLTEQARSGSSTRWTYEMTRPMSPYLATVQIGRYAAQARPAAAPVELVGPPRLALGAGTAFARQGEMMTLFCELFGPYPFTEYRAVVVDDVLEIPLEAQGLSTFGRNFVSGTWDHERLVAHELAHQWFGNSVTARTLSDIWLHEGFACYAEWLWAERRPAAVRRAAMTTQGQAARHHAALPATLGDRTLAAPGMASMFDDWVYKRGALTLHALRAVVGDAVFFDLLRAWTGPYAGQVVTTEQFVTHCVAGSGPLGDQVAATLEAWLHHPELPPLPVLGQP